jgi:tetratricopeptide (TPR) repeat protein
MRALDLARAALAANPHSIRALLAAGVAKLHCGDPAATSIHMDRALAFSPDDPPIHFALCGRASASLFLSAHDPAEGAAARAIATNRSFDAAHRIRAAALAHQGRPAEAAAALDRLRAPTPGVTVERIRAAQPCRLPARQDILPDGLRRAGMPEA